MLHSISETLRESLIPTASAHCDIPCKIYDPHHAQVAALTVVRMMDMIADLDVSGSKIDAGTLNTFSRLVAVKEQHAELCKNEIRVLWGDAFKADQIKAHPDIHELTHKIMQQASECRQSVDRVAGEKLVKLVNSFAEKFWATKDVKTKMVTAPYPPELDVIIPDL